MEVKLSHRRHIPLPNNPYSPCLTILNNCSPKQCMCCKISFTDPSKPVAEFKKNGPPNFHKGRSCRDLRHKLDGLFNQKHFVMQGTRTLLHARSTGYFLVLVPLIAFCIRCIISAFHTKAPRVSVREDSTCRGGHRDGSMSMRWKHALRDIREPDNPDSESKSDSNCTSADPDQYSFEDMHQAYNELEHDYQKFLSQCGMSKHGYWRGGFHEHE